MHLCKDRDLSVHEEECMLAESEGIVKSAQP